MNRLFARSGHMVRNKLCWDANNAVGHSKYWRVRLDWYEFLWLRCPTELFASQNNLFRTTWPDRAKFLLRKCEEGGSESDTLVLHDVAEGNSTFALSYNNPTPRSLGLKLVYLKILSHPWQYKMYTQIPKCLTSSA